MHSTSDLPNLPERPEEIGPTPHRSPIFRWAGLAILTALLVVYLVMRSLGPSDIRGPLPPGLSPPMPAFDFPPLAGADGPLSSHDTTGKVMVVNYWGPWCFYCREEFPHLVQMHSQLRGRDDFVFVSVSCGASEDDDLKQLADETRAFLESSSATFPAYHDPQGASRYAVQAALKLEGFGYPTTLVVDRRGVIRGMWQGYAAGDETSLRKLIDKLLAEPRS